MKIKIAIIINTISYRGPANVVLNILKSLDLKKYDVTLITLKNSNDQNIIKKLENNSINVKQFNIKGRLKVLRNIHFIREFINKSDFNIVHCHGITPDFICSSLNKDIKTISTIHCNLYEDYYSRFGKIIGFCAAKFDIMCLNKIDCNICCSKSVFNALKNKVKNIDYITNGIDLRKIESGETKDVISRGKYKIPEDAFVYVFVGSLNKRKNVKNLVSDFRKYREEDEYLIIVGDGEELSLCKSLTKDDSHIVYAGRQKNVYDYMKISNVYVSYSLSEGMSISCLEALANGNYLLLSNIPSHSELINSSNVYLGEIFNFDDFKSKKKLLRTKLTKTLNNSDVIKYHNENLSSFAMSTKYQKKYESLLEDND